MLLPDDTIFDRRRACPLYLDDPLETRISLISVIEHTCVPATLNSQKDRI